MERWYTVIQDKACFNRRQRVQCAGTECRNRQVLKVAMPRVESLLLKVGVLNGHGPQTGEQLHMQQPEEVALVEAEQALSVQALDALAVRLVNGRTVRLIQADAP